MCYIHIHTYTYTFFRLKPSGRFQQRHFSHFLSVPADKTALVMPGFVQYALVFRESGVLASAAEGVKSSFLEESGLVRNFGPKNYTTLDCPVEIPTTKFWRPWCHYKTHIGIDLMDFESWTPFISMISLGSQSWISLISQSFKFSPYH